jgi:lysophospholipase L1-like esterase
MRLRALLTVIVLLSAPAGATARPVHIVAFGDSATEGWLVPRKDAYPAQLQAALSKKGYDVVVDNAGVTGETTVAALKRFDSAIGPGTDIVIVEFGTNDLHHGVTTRRMHANLNGIIQTLRKRGIEVLVIGLGGLDLSGVARGNTVPYAQWKLPPGKYRARDNEHFSAEGYAILVARTLPQVEMLIRRVEKAPR